MAHYLCTGSCGAVIDQQEYDRGLTKCGTSGCTHEKEDFEQHDDDTDGCLEKS